IPQVTEEFVCAQRFLKSYSRKSEKTYTSFRNEIERYLLWSWTQAGKPVSQLRRVDIETYFDFLHAPPSHWIGTATRRRFEPRGGLGLYHANPGWRPFVARESKSIDAPGGVFNTPNKKAYTLSHAA